ncbi:hypothetical protein SAMN05428995_10928 [Loktanella sp. DSM 29012]|nr:hypothetical protein SAMN05428995_10928 [Loktanella sp. DSM 29012]
MNVDTVVFDICGVLVDWQRQLSWPENLRAQQQHRGLL